VPFGHQDLFSITAAFAEIMTATSSNLGPRKVFAHKAKVSFLATFWSDFREISVRF